MYTICTGDGEVLSFDQLLGIIGSQGTYMELIKYICYSCLSFKPYMYIHRLILYITFSMVLYIELH